MNTCEHLHVSVYYRLYAAQTRYDPAEYESKAQCEDCNEWMDVSDIPEDAERRELYERHRKIAFRFDEHSETDAAEQDIDKVIPVDGKKVIVLPKLTDAKNPAAQALRAISSELRSQQSRENGKKGGRPKKQI